MRACASTTPFTHARAEGHYTQKSGGVATSDSGHLVTEHADYATDYIVNDFFL